jgi:hypothetical protein
MLVENRNRTIFSVTSASGTTYRGDLATESCDCAYAKSRAPAGGCKHVHCVRLATGREAVPTTVDANDQLPQHDESHRPLIYLQSDRRSTVGYSDPLLTYATRSTTPHSTPTPTGIEPTVLLARSRPTRVTDIPDPLLWSPQLPPRSPPASHPKLLKYGCSAIWHASVWVSSSGRPRADPFEGPQLPLEAPQPAILKS